MGEPVPDDVVGLRAERLRLLQILAAQPDSVFDLHVRSAAALTDSEYAAISLVGEQMQWFKAALGVEGVSVPLGGSFCAHGLDAKDDFEVADALADPRFASHPLVVGRAGVRRYAGVPIEFNGHRLGMLCVMGTQPRALTPTQKRWLSDHARAAGEAAASHERIHKLQISERRLVDFASASSDWLWETDEEHRYTWLSGRFEEITGIPAISRLPQRPHDAAMRDPAGRLVEPAIGFLEVLDRRQSFARVVAMKQTAFGERLVSYSAVAKFREDGEFKGYRGTAQDVTHRIDADRQEREVSDTLRLLARHVPGALFQHLRRPDGSSSFPFASDGLRQLFEVTPAEVVNDARVVFERVHPEDRGSVEAHIELAAVMEQPWSQTFRVQLPGAGMRSVSVFASARRLADESVLWHGFAADVTDSERAAAEILRTGQQWELASEAAGIGIFELNLSNATMTLDRNACTVHGLPEDSPTSFVLGQWLDKFSDPARESAQNFISYAAVSGATQREVLAIYTPGGETRKIEFVARAQATKVRTRAPVLVGVCRDVTEQVALDQLRQDVVETREANRNKSELLSRISHELRTPLNGILGFAQLLEGDKKEALTAVQKQRVQTIRMSGTRLLSLVNDVLELSKIEQQMFSLQRDPVPLSDVINSGITLLQPFAMEHDVQVSFVGEALNLHARADRRAMDQVFTNLLSNAIKYNREGGHVIVTVEALSASKLMIRIEDSGVGMTPSQLDQLFQPFNRVGAEKTQVEGTGLGLVIARELTQAMSGTIEVESRPGTGSSFTVRLPLSRRARKQRDNSDPMPMQTDWVEAVGGIALYIEDDPVNAMLMREIFGRLGNWELLEAATGADGLRIAQTMQPQLLLTDMNLPDMSGLDIVRQIRSHPATRLMHIIAVTADALPQQQERAREMGVDAYWTKPLDLGLILKHLRGFFSGNSDYPLSTK
jgi:signal transduction histidine kinase/CheY-like chemotaxis protein